MNNYPREALQDADIEDVGWLAGWWMGRAGQDLVEEIWSPVGGGVLMGMFRWIKDRQVYFYEFIVVEQADGQVWMRIKHFYPGLRGWEEKDRATDFLLVRMRDREAVFWQVDKPENWLVYRLDPDGALKAFFEKEDEPVKPEDVFQFTRRAA